jgi:hypothetical protein
MTKLDAELTAPLGQILTEVVAAVARKPFRERIADHT